MTATILDPHSAAETYVSAEPCVAPLTVPAGICCAEPQQDGFSTASAWPAEVTGEDRVKRRRNDGQTQLRPEANQVQTSPAPQIQQLTSLETKFQKSSDPV